MKQFFQSVAQIVSKYWKHILKVIFLLIFNGFVRLVYILPQQDVLGDFFAEGE